MKTKTVEELVALVMDQLQWQGMLKDDVPMEDLRVIDFAYAATSLAKQFMDTTKDAVLNAKTVLSYGLPATLAEVSDPEAKEMIEHGNFYRLAMRIIEQFEAGEFPTPDSSNVLAAFQDASGRAIEEDSQKGALCSYTEDYMAHMKALAKEMGVKGKNLFHPIRLAITGEMSGQDVTKQLSLLAMATSENSAIDSNKIDVVSFEERMKRLKAFCESIPEEFRVPRAVERKQAKSERKENEAEVETAQASQTASIVRDPKDTYEGPPITALDIRVGRIKKVWEHPEAEKLYCEEIDVGEDEPRQIASGLRPYLKPEDMEGRLVLVLCNLKERKLVGFPSHGMVLCASNADHTDVRLVCPPVDAEVGERITIPDFDFESEEGAPFAENKIGKKKVFENIAPHLVTNKYGIPMFLGRPFMTSAGACTSPIPDGSVS
jgi:methionine--tRNA ligase beta chain